MPVTTQASVKNYILTTAHTFSKLAALIKSKSNPLGTKNKSKSRKLQNGRRIQEIPPFKIKPLEAASSSSRNKPSGFLKSP